MDPHHSQIMSHLKHGVKSAHINGAAIIVRMKGVFLAASTEAIFDAISNKYIYDNHHRHRDTNEI